MKDYSKAISGFCFRCRRKVPLMIFRKRFYCRVCNAETSKVYMSKLEIQKAIEFFKPV